MEDNTTNNRNDEETVDAASIGRANNPISKATLLMIAGAVIFIIIAGVIITKVFNSPTGGTGADLPGASSTGNR